MNQREEAHLREREAEKEEAVTAVEEALARIEQQEREPDQWERVFIAEAIGAIFRGSYFPAQKAVFGRPCSESGRADERGDAGLDIGLVGAGLIRPEA
jgi:hypothetical protein